MNKTLIAGVLAFSCSHAMALSGMTGNVIKPICAGDDKNNSFTCSMWIDALEHGLVLGHLEQAITDGTTKVDAFNMVSYCMAVEGVTTTQKQQIYAKYLNDHPAQLHQMAATLFIDAMKEAFPLPCKR